MSSNLVARVIVQIPEPRKHNNHYYGFYSSRARALRKQDNLKVEPESSNERDAKTHEPELSQKARAALRKRWANLIQRVFKTDPLLCDCGGSFRVLAFITEPKVIAKIVQHLKRPDARAPPA